MAFGWALVGCWPVFVGSGLVFDRLLANRLAEPVTDLSSTGSARAWPRVRPRRPPWRPPRRPPCGPATQQAQTSTAPRLGPRTSTNRGRWAGPRAPQAPGQRPRHLPWQTAGAPHQSPWRPSPAQRPRWGTHGVPHGSLYRGGGGKGEERAGR